jgi:Bifunctional DNA primase/polymerase, N-terminal
MNKHVQSTASSNVICIPDRLRDPRFRFIKVNEKRKTPAEYFFNCDTVEKMIVEWQRKRTEAKDNLRYSNDRRDKENDNAKINDAIRAVHQARLEDEFWENFPQPNKLTNYRFDDVELLKWLKDGGNYGVLCDAGGLRVFDQDEYQRLKELGIAKRFPKTFTVQSRPGKRHVYLIVPDLPERIVLFDPLELDENDNHKHLGEIQGPATFVVGPVSIHEITGKPYEIIDGAPIAPK